MVSLVLYFENYMTTHLYNLNNVNHSEQAFWNLC